MCNISKSKRIDTYLSLKHPWITRDKLCKIIPYSFSEKKTYEEKLLQYKQVSYISYTY